MSKNKNHARSFVEVTVKIIWKDKVQLISGILLVIMLSGCATSLKYTSPDFSDKYQNSITINKSKDIVWDESLEKLSAEFFVINNIEKNSGFMSLDFNSDPENYVDCGYLDIPINGAMHMTPAARSHMSYKIFTPNLIWDHVSRTMKLDGKINLHVRSLGPSKTKVTVNVKYIVTKNYRSNTSFGSDVIQFNGNQNATFPGVVTTCAAKGTLEKRIFNILSG